MQIGHAILTHVVGMGRRRIAQDADDLSLRQDVPVVQGKKQELANCQSSSYGSHQDVVHSRTLPLRRPGWPPLGPVSHGGQHWVRLKHVGLGFSEGYNCPLTQYLLADAVGLSAVQVNRVLRELREDGLVSFQNGARLHRF